MSSRPWMPLYVADFQCDTLDLKADEVGIYMILLMLAWRREDAALPNDMAWLKRSLQSCVNDFHGHQFNRIVPALLNRYFELGQDDKWRNKRLTKERQKADKLSAKQKQNADKRWCNSNENNVIAHPSAMPSQLQSQREERIGEFRKVGEGKPSGPRHGAISSSRGTVFIRFGTDDWRTYASDYRQAFGVEPEPDKHGGFWFKIAGAIAPPPPKRLSG